MYNASPCVVCESWRNASLNHRVRPSKTCVSAPGSDLPASFSSLDAAPKSNLLVEDELPNDAHPALVIWQIVVELVRNPVKLVQPGPGNRGEVVVLVV